MPLRTAQNLADTRRDAFPFRHDVHVEAEIPAGLVKMMLYVLYP